MEKYCIISVTDKRYIDDFAMGLIELGYSIISTGGTAEYLRNKGLSIIEIKDFTGFPEILNGRVKTLHPAVFGGILADRDKSLREIKNFNIKLIDIIVCNLYNIKDNFNKDIEEFIESIDIGGHSLLRAGAKNYKYTLTVIDRADYKQVLKHLKEHDGFTIDFSLQMARKTFSMISHYDDIINKKFSDVRDLNEHIALSLDKIEDLRYGENPQQKAGLYRINNIKSSPFFNMQKLWGKELSYNNIIDIEAGFNIVSQFKIPAAVIIKHTNPCGAAIDKDIYLAYKKAIAGDPVSAYGSIIAVNETIEAKIAEEISKTFVEVVIAPEYSQKALKILKRKKNLRIIILDFNVKLTGYCIREVMGMSLIQERNTMIFDDDKIKVVTKRKPTYQEWEDIDFAWKICKFVKSNGIVYAKNGMVLGIGAGQMSRVDSAEIGVMKATKYRHDLSNSVLASDAFFPFRDGIDAAGEAGATAIVQPGGSIHDEDVIEAANERNIAMVFTGIRHFRH